MKNEYKIVGDSVVIFINHKNKRYEAIISLEDLDLVKSYPYTWFGHKLRELYVHGNYMINGKRKTISLQRWIMCEASSSDLVVDHINQDTLDNRRCNLRMITDGQNQQNSLKPRSSNEVKGITWFKKYNKWRVRVCADRKVHHIGFFEDFEEAKYALEVAQKKYQPFLSMTISERMVSNA